MIIDVSHHNGVIDWYKTGKMVDFVILRCGYGSNTTTQDDKQFYYNATKCEKYGIPYGVYLYSYAKNKENLVSEVSHILRMIKGRTVFYPIYLDLEENEIAKTGVFPELAKLFVKLIRSNGKNAGLYSGNYLYNKYLYDIDCDCRWVARYNTNEPNVRYDIWQYSSKGCVDGISTRVDLNKLDTDKYHKFDTEFYSNIVSNVLAGTYGNGEERKKALFNKGINYTKVQNMVNQLYNM